ncbi:MAG TPA: VRR-NUC domain-containing protein [Ktedonobacteraceae bacterium]|nr:VRR-NUC domain-containing protein [Ktedonobacteraceae bacterium]
MKKQAGTKQSALPIRLPVFSEAEFLQQIIQAARLQGWYVFHDYHSKWNGRGYLDLTLCHPKGHGFFIAELKIDGGELSPEQKEWIAALEANDVEVHVWKPEHIEEIIHRLKVA